MEEGVLARWERDNTFAASVAARPAGENGDNEFIFYDGPPFANGLPHYGHLLTGFVKDAVPRYQTMRGRHVERRFGWDCHGLPAEVEAEKELGIAGHPAIAAFGIDKFNDACRTSVLRYTDEWQRYVTRQARWVDFANDYKTLDTPYMESVMWAFRTLWDKGLIYEGFRVLAYCWRCETPLSNTETRMDDVYKDRQDPALTVAFQLDSGEKILAWTTTPWTIPANMAICLNEEFDYGVYKTSKGNLVLAEGLAEKALSDMEIEGAELIKKFKGEGEVLEDLEWDVKSYFILSGAMHDSAIAAWGIKGYYDYIRPMSSIRYMSDKGQSSDTTLLNYHPHGIPLVPGYIEIIAEGDPLEGEYLENIGKIKLFTWRGHDFIINADYDIAGVGWILAENWFPYQRPSFITPPFAGYVSGHSTFSRAAAEVLTLLTNDEYFPGGMGTFNVYKNDFLKFEVGPSVDFQLQWATYRDASDLTSLSRIWGGIHPPIDDIPGRIIGKKIGIDAFEFGENYFEKEEGFESVIYPNPAGDFINIQYKSDRQLNVEIYDLNGRKIISNPIQFNNLNRFRINVSNLIQGFYIIYLVDDSDNEVAIYKMLKD